MADTDNKNDMTNSGLDEDQYYQDMEENDELGDVSSGSDFGALSGDDSLDDDLAPPDSSFLEDMELEELPPPAEVPENSSIAYDALADIASSGKVSAVENNELANDMLDEPVLDNSLDSSGEVSSYVEGESGGDMSVVDEDTMAAVNDAVSSDDSSDAKSVNFMGGFGSGEPASSGDKTGSGKDNASDVSSSEPQDPVINKDVSVGMDQYSAVSSDGQTSASSSDSEATDGSSAASAAESDTTSVTGAESESELVAGDARTDSGLESSSVPSPEFPKNQVVVKQSFPNPSSKPKPLYLQEANRPAVRKANEQDTAYKLERRNQAVLDTAKALNKEVMESISEVKQMNLSIVDMISKVNATDERIRGLINRVNDLNIRMDGLLERSHNLLSDRYMDNIQKVCERNLASFIESSRNNYVELFRIAVKDYRNFSDAAMKFQRGMEAKFSNEFRMLVKIVYLLPVLVVMNLLMVGFIIWKLW